MIKKKLKTPVRIPYDFNELRFKHDKYRNYTDVVHVPPHSHEFYEIEFIISKGETSVNNSSLKFDYGIISLCTPTDLHSYSITSATRETYNISFSDTFVDSLSVRSDLTKISGLLMTLSQDDIIFFRRLFEKFKKYSNSSYASSVTYIRKILEFIIMDLITTAKSTKKVENNNVKTIFNAITYIQNNFHKNITLEEVADRLYLSRNYFSTLFHKEFGMTFSQYLNDVRLKNVCNLLANDGRSIAQIAESSGFNSEKHFYRIFKKQFGITPFEYRKKYMR